MARETIIVGYNSSPTVNLTLRDENGTVVDLSSYTIQLIVKQSLELPDSRAWFDKAGAVVTAADGTYKFVLTPAETRACPGIWPGEIRFWSGATSSPPNYRRSVDYVVEDPVDEA